MKLKSIKKKIWSIVIIITTLIGILPVQANTTETPVKDVELDGRWDDRVSGFSWLVSFLLSV